MALSFFDQAVNYFPDPGFESGFLSSGGQVLGTGAVDTTRVGEPTIEGNHSLVVACSSSGTGATTIVRHFWTLPTEPNISWSFACEAAYVTTGMYAQLRVSFHDLALNEIRAVTDRTASGQMAPDDLLIENELSPGDAAWARVGLALVREGAANGTPGKAAFDRVVASTTQEAIPYFSGDTGGSRWTGPRFASPSERLGTGASLETLRRLVPPYWTSEEGA